jgi:hypothetical protein
MKKASVIGGVILIAAMWFFLGFSLAADRYKPMLEKANGELTITKLELQQAKSELATFQGILKTLVEGENPEGMRSPR